ncbi:glycoside hydrolase family 3 C-terminal domain-containing protein [Cellulosimicrobium terreum]|nr:glycoside hydrolase family 3 C-terminal domain-containing protein [Cellulosimicrobium terreum]
MASTRPGADRPALVLSDGPSGLAMNLPDFSGKVPATSFPAPVALASSWDTALLQEVGSAIGAEARAAGAHVLLGPSVNIRRSPLGGRNFEYYAEDPYVAGRLGAAFVRGVQSRGVGACVKHFAVNSQETDRMRVSAEVGERALREIYLPAFEHVVTAAAPAMVMASYNRVNGVHAAQHPWLLTQVLREEWGFDGAVVSDWGAVDDTVDAVAAGLDLQMPGPAPSAHRSIVSAVTEGRLDRTTVDRAAERLGRVARRWGAQDATGGVEPDRAAHEALARRAAAESFVLLRNEDDTLPLGCGGRLLVVGELAASLRREGGGSAEVSAGSTGDDLLDALRHGWSGTLGYEPGYLLDPTADLADRVAARDAAVRASAIADAVVIVVGAPAGSDTEGHDRSTIDLPADHDALVEAVAATGKPVTVVLNSGGVLTLPWRGRVGAILHAWLPGCAGGGALADVLLGVVSPSGRLTETIPLSVEDTPTWPGFPATDHRALHAEGLLVGYRWYDRRGSDVAYPFGHGLGYTTFEHSDLVVVDDSDGDQLALRFTLTNTGGRDGVETWQLYAATPDPSAGEALRRLVAFGKVRLAPGESRDVAVALDRRSLAHWDEGAGCWHVRAGQHVIELGASSRDLRARVVVERTGEPALVTLTAASTLREWMQHPSLGAELLAAVEETDRADVTRGLLTNPTVLTMIGDMPIHRLFGDPTNALSATLIGQVLRREVVDEG